MKRTHTGSTLIYGLAAFLAVALIFGFITLNYQQLFGYHKQAQNAVDAAAIAVAKDVQKVTILDPRLGRIGVVDQYGTAGLEQRPILSINTVLATARLDALVAQQLNNTTIMAAATQDLQNAKAAARNLANAVNNYIRGGTAQDADGRTINGGSLLAVAANAYNVNNRRSSRGFKDLTAADFTIEVGDLRSALGAQ
ncbi:MAG TPA: pilus assembly protein TadG-related protein, partial [Candidatus Obscuribacter sp.]|nr:pilus assembly protein TadG-related protein [Candidatus Obscuribacter sp.]